MRYLIWLLLLVLAVAGGAWFVAGRMDGPPIEFRQPERYIGLSTPVEVAVGASVAELTALTITVEQNGEQFPVYSLGDADADVEADAVSVRVTRVIDREAAPELESGPARIVVTAARPVVYGIRMAESRAAKDVEVRLERPRVAVVSTHHYINHGGSELVVYRATPEDVESGVLVGDVEYPGYSASSVDVPGIDVKDPALRVAFFALRHDQDLKTPIRLYARDPAGNTARAEFEHRVFPKPFKQSRITLDDGFLERVVPAVLAGTTEIHPEGDLITKYLAINGELRRKNAETIASFAEQTAPRMLWRGAVFYPFTNTSVESAFADQRTYVYHGEEVDQQVHLGFDLASVAGTPIVAANRGIVLFADELGIYGNCVIVDHGMGVQSLYGHLSTLEVQPGQTVEKGQTLGRSGMTGLAGGDHLHFTMLVNGQMVNPLEWWDPHWIEDRILRKLEDVGGAAPAAPEPDAEASTGAIS